jgi:hypothetical protein
MSQERCLRNRDADLKILILILTALTFLKWVQTDMGNAGAEAAGVHQADITLEDSINGLVSVIDKATREETSGNLMNYDGSVLPW